MASFLLETNSEQKEQINREKYAFYCGFSQMHINLEKNTKKHQIYDFFVLYV